MTGNNDLIAAAYRKDRRTFERLLDAGADINVTDEDARTVLMHAVLDSDPDPSFIRYLLEQGAAPDIADANQRWTALHFAAQAQQPDVVAMLIEAGAKIDAQDVFGNTPLWRAVMVPRPNPAVVELLVSAGADPAKKNFHGVSPISLAEKRGLADLQGLLQAKRRP
ncbi:MAG: ankyrin repeat domain-containing protein [Acidobacteriota bacterium]